jgi:hypothetical protein
LIELAQGCPGAARPEIESAFALYRQIGSHERAKHLSLLLQAILDESQQCLTDGKIHSCTGRELTYELANNLLRFSRQPGSVIVDREGYTQMVRNKRDASRLTGAATIYYREDQQRKRMISLVVVDTVCNS